MLEDKPTGLPRGNTIMAILWILRNECSQEMSGKAWALEADLQHSFSGDLWHWHVICEHWLKTQLLCFWLNSLLQLLGRLQRISQEHGPLLLKPFREWSNIWKCKCSLCVVSLPNPFCHSAFQRNKELNLLQHIWTCRNWNPWSPHGQRRHSAQQNICPFLSQKGLARKRKPL